MAGVRDQVFSLGAALLLVSGAVSAATVLRVPRSTQSITIDGVIGEAEWAAVAPLPLTHEIDPQVLAPTTWETTVRITHDGSNLSLAIDARDPDLARIVAPRGARDSIGSSNQDYVTVAVDAEGGRQRHYEFRVNAAGVLDDRIVGGSSGGSPEWSGNWVGAAQRTATGYTVEIAIPLTTLNARHTASGDLELALNVTRHIGRGRYETVSLQAVDRRLICQECQYGVFRLTGVEGDSQALQLRPYLAVRRASRYPDDAPASASTAVDPGVDVLWRLGAGRKLVGTLNPDFSEVAPDQIQFDVNRRYAVSFTENRPFFTENTGLFSGPLPLVYTRSIADPRAAVAYSAETPQVSVGAIYASDRATSFIQAGQGGARVWWPSMRPPKPSWASCSAMAAMAGAPACC